MEPTITELEETIRQMKRAKDNEQRDERYKLKTKRDYHTVLTDLGGIRVIGNVTNMDEFDAHFKKYGSITDKPAIEQIGVEYLCTIDYQLIHRDGGYIHDMLPHTATKITAEEWQALKDGEYPERLIKIAAERQW